MAFVSIKITMMKMIARWNGLLVLLLFSTWIACAQQTTQPVLENTVPLSEKVMEDPGSGMTFERTRIDLGTIEKGEMRELEYTFTNTGTEDLTISQVSTCDCTEVLSRPYLPIKPGTTGTIKVKFDSNKKDDEDPVEIEIWLEKEDPATGMPVLERVDYIFQFAK